MCTYTINEYPQLIIDLKKLYHNITSVKDDCSKMGIQITGVIKGFNGIAEVARQFEKAGCAQIGTSRIDQIKEAKEAGIDAVYMLIRIPMKSEAAHVVRYADISLNSELEVIEELNRECGRQNKRHGIVLMADLGDLREGFWDKQELVDAAMHIERNLKNLELKGIGTNLGCYGSIKPTPGKLNELCILAAQIEEKLGRRLEIVSGGATSSYPLVLDGTIPDGINHLRIGEGIILAYDLKDLWGLDMSKLYQDIFTFQAEIIEIKKKPTHPVGEIFIDSFGNKPVYEDRGIRKRAILGTGKLDYAINDKIFPRLPGITIVGSSSDHTILDIEDCNKALNIGDIIEFDVAYPSLMYLTNNRFVNVVIVE